MADTTKAAPEIGDVCRIIRSPDGGVRIECTDANSAKLVIDAALGGKFTVAFVPKSENQPPAKPDK